MLKYRLKTYQRYRRSAMGQLNVGNSFWSAFAAIFHENGSYSEAWSGRLVLVAWWAAILILTSTYTANLTAWLTQARLQGQIDTVADLLNNPAYSYGVIGSTGTESAIKRQRNRSPLYNTLYRNMDANGWIVRTSEADGVAKVQDGNFALFLPKSTIFSYNNQQPCNTRLAAETFERSIYGVVMQKPALFLKVINAFVTFSIESGIIRSLEHKWFVEKGQCQGKDSGADGAGVSGQMRPGDMTGIIMVIYASMAIGFLLLIVEKCRHSRYKAKKYRLKEVAKTAPVNAVSE